jgi:hypothetical protein
VPDFYAPAVKKFWKLEAIDSLGLAFDDNMHKEERSKMIEELIGNPQIKEILLSRKL